MKTRIGIVLVVLLCLAFSAAVPLPAQASPVEQAKGKLVEVFTQATPGDQALQLNTTFILIDAATNLPNPNLSIKSVELTQLDTSDKYAGQFRKADSPFYIALLLDTSGSMASSLKDVQNAATEALRTAPKGAQFAVYTFNDGPQLVQTFTGDLNAAASAIQKAAVPANTRGTCLYDAGYMAVDAMLKTPEGRRAMILFTDGKDEVLGGGKCSKQTYTTLVDYAIKSKVPINTIGLSASEGSVNKNELESMASNTGGFSAIGSRDKMAASFKLIMDALNSQWEAQFSMTPTKGRHEAAFTVTFSDESKLSYTLSFESDKDYYVAPAPFSVSSLVPVYDQASQQYHLTINMVSPQLIKTLKVEIWDKDTNTKTGNETTFNMPVTDFTINAAGLVAKHSYSFHISAVDMQDMQLTNAKGDTTLLVHDFKFDPSIVTVSLQITSVEFGDEELIVHIQVKNEDQISGYEGWLVDENTKTQVPKYSVKAQSPAADGIIEFPMAEIPTGKYTVFLRTLDKSNQPGEPINYGGITYTAKAAPSLFSRMLQGLKANSWIIFAILGVLALGGGLLIFFAIRSNRVTGTPVLQGKMESSLSQDQLPVSNTMVFSGDMRAAAGVKPGPSVASKPVIFVRQTPSVSLQGQRIPLSPVPFTIGRKECDLNFEDDLKISRRHVQIAFDPNQRHYYIVDVGSVNGVWLNGIRLMANQPAWLSNGSQIDLGPDTKLVFEMR